MTLTTLRQKIAHGLAAFLAALLLFQPDALAFLNAVLMKVPSGGKVAQVVGFLILLFTRGPAVLQLLTHWFPTKTDPPKGAAVLVLLGTLTLGVSTVRAETTVDRELGGCTTGPKLGTTCFGPSASVTVGQFNFTDHKFTGGVMPGAGYGVTFAADKWYSFSAALYLAFQVGGDKPNFATPALMFAFADYARAGLGVTITEQASGPTSKQWLLMFGLGKDFSKKVTTP